MHIIINPASGPDRPILKTLNAVFQAAGIDWEIYVTKQAGDTYHFARQALAAGAEVVAAYGGDGTVMEAASALAGGEIPLAIFPGGTGNVTANELGIPPDLVGAAHLVGEAPSRLRSVDMGQVDERLFILRVAIGLLAEIGPGANRQLKDYLGKLAYPLSAIQHLSNQKTARYYLTLDGQAVEAEGVLCTILNVGGIGVGRFSLARGIQIDDGLLDVVVLTRANLAALATIITNSIAGEEANAEMQHWQAREITIVSEPPQAVTLDGELLHPTPLNIRLVPNAVRVIVPDKTDAFNPNLR